MEYNGEILGYIISLNLEAKQKCFKEQGAFGLFFNTTMLFDTQGRNTICMLHLSLKSPKNGRWISANLFLTELVKHTHIIKTLKYAES